MGRMDDTAVEHALAEAYDPELGARPLRRYLEKHIVSAISRRIIAGELAAGQVAVVSFSNGGWDVCAQTVSAPRDDETPMARSESSGVKRTASQFTSRSALSHLEPKR